MALEQDMAVLGAVAPLSMLDREAHRLIAFSGDKRRLRAGDVLFRKGDPTSGGAVVLSGSITLEDAEGGGNAHVVARGALIGELALIVPTKHEAQAIALDRSEVLMISRHLFRRVLEEFPHNAAEIRRAYAERLRAMNLHISRVRRRLEKVD